MKTLIFAILSVSVQAQASPCERNLELPLPPMNRTESLISYLNLLVDQRILGEKEILSWRDHLQAGELTNPIPLNSTNTDSSAHVHFGEVQKQIERAHLDIARLLKWSLDLLAAKRQTLTTRKDVQKDTRDVYQKIKFLPVPGETSGLGSYLAKWVRWHVKKRATTKPARTFHSFEMMTTPVTQKQWTEVMGVNPAADVVGPNATHIVVGAQQFLMQPDNPVENMSWWSAAVFANRMSERAGLPPVYDLSKIQFIANTSAGAGNLMRQQGELHINAPDGNLYLAMGYRLPTKAEYDYALNKAGFPSHDSRYGKSALTHAWLSPNHNGASQPVALLSPYKINGNSFYDLVGNVAEWCHEPATRDMLPEIDIATTRVSLAYQRTHYGSPIDRNETFNWYSADHRWGNIGLRLVRTVNP